MKIRYLMAARCMVVFGFFDFTSNVKILCTAIQASGVHNSISLVATGTPHLSTDNELQITYGDKSNEELLFLYGEIYLPCLDPGRVCHHCSGMTKIFAVPV